MRNLAIQNLWLNKQGIKLLGLTPYSPVLRAKSRGFWLLLKGVRRVKNVQKTVDSKEWSTVLPFVQAPKMTKFSKLKGSLDIGLYVWNNIVDSLVRKYFDLTIERIQECSENKMDLLLKLYSYFKANNLLAHYSQWMISQGFEYCLISSGCCLILTDITLIWRYI